MIAAYETLFTIVLAVLGVLLFFCLLRAVRGPRIADRVMGINMIGTIIIMMIAVLALMKNEGYLVDICLIYAMISFLAVVCLTKVYMGVYQEQKMKKRRKKEKEKNDMD